MCDVRKLGFVYDLLARRGGVAQLAIVRLTLDIRLLLHCGAYRLAINKLIQVFLQFQGIRETRVERGT